MYTNMRIYTYIPMFTYINTIILRAMCPKTIMRVVMQVYKSEDFSHKLPIKPL